MTTELKSKKISNEVYFVIWVSLVLSCFLCFLILSIAVKVCAKLSFFMLCYLN